MNIKQQWQREFVRNSLVPEGATDQGRAFQVTDASVSPTRIVGRGRFGVPIEETICMLAKSANFVDSMGNICTVALRTGRVYSEEPEAVRYEMIVTMDQIRAGSVPLEHCPHTTHFAPLVGPGPLVREVLVEGDKAEDCGGRPGAERFEDACPHMQALITKRRAFAAELSQQAERELTQLTPTAAAGLLKQMAQAFAIVAPIAAEAPEAPAPTNEGAPRSRRGT